MQLNEIKIGIQNALLKGTLKTPGPNEDQAWGEWVEWMTVYLFEFVKRAIQKGMALEDAERHALRAWKRQYQDATASALLDDMPHTEEQQNAERRDDERNAGGRGI
jgi:hypothetical protein